jgi:hypothetical protein
MPTLHDTIFRGSLLSADETYKIITLPDEQGKDVIKALDRGFTG